MLGSIVNLIQAAFVPWKHLQDHVLLAQELVRGYSTKGDAPKCMLQMDIQKPYDSVEWRAIKDILAKLSFPNQYISWVMTVVKTVSYRYKVNDGITDVLQAKRGVKTRGSLVTSPFCYSDGVFVQNPAEAQKESKL